jgi:branched-chain amino acid transport system permease protein
VQFLISVFVLAAMYAILGAGFVTIYKASRLLNFAYGDVALVIAYITVAFSKLIGGPAILPIALSLLFSFVLGFLIYISLIRPMVGEFPVAIIILTVALGIILNSVTILIFGGDLEEISIGWRANYSPSNKIYISGVEIVTIIVTIVFFLILGAFYRFSKVGRQMRATAENLLLSAQRRINIFFITGIAWGIGIFATGVAGILFGANYGVSSHMGNVVIIGLGVGLVGGLDSLKGVIPAAIIISLAEKLGSYYLNPRLGETIPFVIMLFVLIFRPWGIFGTQEEIERV